MCVCVCVCMCVLEQKALVPYLSAHIQKHRLDQKHNFLRDTNAVLNYENNIIKAIYLFIYYIIVH